MFTGQDTIDRGPNVKAAMIAAHHTTPLSATTKATPYAGRQAYSEDRFEASKQAAQLQ
jgi:hypothetical protein